MRVVSSGGKKEKKRKKEEGNVHFENIVWWHGMISMAFFSLFLSSFLFFWLAGLGLVARLYPFVKRGFGVGIGYERTYARTKEDVV